MSLSREPLTLPACSLISFLSPPPSPPSQVGDGVFEVLSTSGDTHLGGDDFDKRIVDWLAEDFQKAVDENLVESKIGSGADERTLFQRITPGQESVGFLMGGMGFGMGHAMPNSILSRVSSVQGGDFCAPSSDADDFLPK